jgi:DNA modification methylase
MLAMALQADGWWLRSSIIWAKGLSFCKTYAGSCMPGSQKDRPTKSHEQVFLFTKSARYFYDGDAVRERATGTYSEAKKLTWSQRVAQGHYSSTPEWGDIKAPHRKGTGDSFQMVPPPAGRSLRSVWTLPDEDAFAHYCATQGVDLEALAQGFVDGNRELKSTWVINPAASKLKHFASFPPRLVEPAIKAGTSERGCCPECGAGWERVVERVGGDAGESMSRPKGRAAATAGQAGHGTVTSTLSISGRDGGWDGRGTKTTTTGWRPTCECYDDRYRSDFPQAKSARKRRQRQASGNWWRRVRKRPGRDYWKVEPCVVADPFVGKGTTLRVAIQLGRRGVGIDLSGDYCAMAAAELDAPIQVRML